MANASSESGGSGSKTGAIVGVIVAVIVAAGAAWWFWLAPVEVPEVVGLSQDEAKGKLESAKLTLGEVGEAMTGSADAGNVVSQTPEAGAKADRGSAVNVTVEVASVLVPGVIGQSADAAGTAITGAGLTVGEQTEQQTTDSPAGSVLSQSPAEDERVASGATVDLTIAAEPPEVRIKREIQQAHLQNLQLYLNGDSEGLLAAFSPDFRGIDQILKELLKSKLLGELSSLSFVNQFKDKVVDEVFNVNEIQVRTFEEMGASLGDDAGQFKAGDAFALLQTRPAFGARKFKWWSYRQENGQWKVVGIGRWGMRDVADPQDDFPL